MPVPSSPSLSQSVNSIGDILKIKKDYFNNFGKGLTDVKKIAKATNKRLIKIEKVAKDVSKTAKNAKDVTDNLKKGKYKKVNSSMAIAINFALSLASIGISLLTVNHVGNLQEVQIRKEKVIEKDLGIAFQNFVKNALTIRKLRAEFNKFKARYDEDKGRVLNQVQESFTNSVEAREKSEAAKKQANDALYEAREGRKKVEAKISELNKNFQQITDDQRQLVAEIANQNKELANRIEDARKLGNDALYEVRQGRSKIDARIDTKFQEARKLGNDALYEARQGRQIIDRNSNAIDRLKSSLSLEINKLQNQSSAQLNRLTNGYKGLIDQAINQAKAAQANANKAQANSRGLQQQINQNKAEISRLKNPSTNLNLDAKIQQLIAASPRIQGLTAALKAAGIKVDGIERYILPALDTAIKTVGYKAQLIDGRVTKLETDITRKDPGISRVESQLGGIKARIGKNESNISINQSKISINQSDINNLKTRVNEREKVDRIALGQLNQIAAALPLIPARAAGLIRPSIPTTAQITAATTTGVCRSTAPGGCMSNALNNTANNIGQQLNNVGDAINRNIDKLNLGANAAQLALLKRMDLKLGKQIAGGLSGQAVKTFEKVTKFAEWLRIDRILNVLTWVNTTHNAFMLSSSITNTLFGAIDNVANIFFKDINGVDIDSKKAVSTYFDNMAKAVFGVENWKNLTTTIKKANRIYQSGANIVDSVRSMTDSVRNVAEFTAENTGKIGNALKTYQVIAPDAFKWMPEKVDGQSVWVQRLQNLEEAASGIEMVSSEVLSITQNANEIKKQVDEFNKNVEDLAPKDRKDNKPVAEKAKTQKTASVSPAVPEVTEETFQGVSA